MNNPAENMSKAAEEMAKAAEDMNKASEKFDKASEEMKVLEKESEHEVVDQGTDTVKGSSETAVDANAAIEIVVIETVAIETIATETGLETGDYTDAGDIGDEQMPAGDIKTDKRVWSYDASKNKIADLPRKVKEFVAGL